MMFFFFLEFTIIFLVIFKNHRFHSMTFVVRVSNRNFTWRENWFFSYTFTFIIEVWIFWFITVMFISMEDVFWVCCWLYLCYVCYAISKFLILVICTFLL